MQFHHPRLVQNPSVKQRIYIEDGQPPLVANPSSSTQVHSSVLKISLQWVTFLRVSLATSLCRMTADTEVSAVSLKWISRDCERGCAMTRVAIACRGWVRCVELQGRKCNYWPASALLYWSVAASVAAMVSVLAARSGGTTINPTTNPPKMYFCLRLVRLFLISAILCVGKCAVSGVTNGNLKKSSRALRKVQKFSDVQCFLIWREDESSDECGSKINACEFLIFFSRD